MPVSSVIARFKAMAQRALGLLEAIIEESESGGVELLYLGQ